MCIKGNPLSFYLTPEQACDLDGANQLLLNIVADTVLADKGYDASERVIERLIRHRVKPQ
ncbi:transposase [Nostoc sp.]|uniref:transposase n=1 Tax=Nostoc sp. TaxID=1180 RepID=UPI003FA5271C